MNNIDPSLFATAQSPALMPPNVIQDWFESLSREDKFRMMAWFSDSLLRQVRIDSLNRLV